MAGTVQCPQCDARNPGGAQWCGQCFAALEGPVETDRSATEPEPLKNAPPDAGQEPIVPPAVPAPPVAEEPPVPGTWACSACQTSNPLAEEQCSACGTSIFTAFGAAAEETTAEVEPQAALTRSLVFPGLGHAMAGQGLLGSAIGGLTLMALGFGIALAASGVERFGWPLIILAAGVWVLAAVDAYRIAGERSTDGILLKPRLITALVGLVVILVILAALSSQGTSG